MEAPNKGHTGENINLDVLFFVERFPSFGGSKCTVRTIGNQLFGSFVDRFIIETPLLLFLCIPVVKSPVHNLTLQTKECKKRTVSLSNYCTYIHTVYLVYKHSDL